MRKLYLFFGLNLLLKILKMKTIEKADHTISV